MSRKLKIAGACLNQTPIDWKGNLERVGKAIAEAREGGVQILCLPELCITGYGCEDLFLSDWLPKKALECLEVLLPQAHGISVCVGLPIRFDGSTYNCVAMIENGKVLGVYAKHNLANDGVHYEPRWFSSWPFRTVKNITIGGKSVPFGAITLEVMGVQTGFEICEDAWQEDRPAGNFADQSVELILNPSASHFAFNKEEFRENLVVSSSAQFQCTYLYSNLLGNEAGRMIYDGDILIARNGTLIGHNRRLSFKDYNLLSVEVDFDKATHTMDLRKDHRTKLEEFSHAVPLALFDYCRKSRSRGFVLSLSGGADSSSIATLVAHMVKLGTEELGSEEFKKKIGLDCKEVGHKALLGHLLQTAYQATQNSSSATKASAQQLSDALGAPMYDWHIDEEVTGYTRKIEKALGTTLNWQDHDIALQNIQARARSPIIWMLANLSGSLLLTTSNRSEGDVGYATMDGDTSGSISPIAAVDKHFILKWLKYAENELGYEGLSTVNALRPTAELRPPDQHQTDEDDLMPYEVLVRIEQLAIRNRKGPVEVYEALRHNFDDSQLKSWITKFFRLWARNQWKRERIAPSFHVDDFNIDPRTWCRFPILSGGFEEELEALNQLH